MAAFDPFLPLGPGSLRPIADAGQNDSMVK
jgi:hypothetical protein